MQASAEDPAVHGRPGGGARRQHARVHDGAGGPAGACHDPPGLEETRGALAGAAGRPLDKLRLGVRAGERPASRPRSSTRTRRRRSTRCATRPRPGRRLRVATDASGNSSRARTVRDGRGRPGARPIVRRALEGEESGRVAAGRPAFTAVAQYRDSAATGCVGTAIHRLPPTRRRRRQLRKPARSPSCCSRPASRPAARHPLGAREPALAAALTRPELSAAASEPFEVDLAGERHVGVRIPLRTVAGEEIGAALALGVASPPRPRRSATFAATSCSCPWA